MDTLHWTLTIALAVAFATRTYLDRRWRRGAEDRLVAGARRAGAQDAQVSDLARAVAQVSADVRPTVPSSRAVVEAPLFPRGDSAVTPVPVVLPVAVPEDFSDDEVTRAACRGTIVPPPRRVPSAAPSDPTLVSAREVA